MAVALALAVAGCGSKSSSNSSPSSSSGSGATQSAPQKQTHFAKTKFLFHAGLAFGAFHRYIYKPFKAGALTKGGLLSHKKAALKAGLAGLFAYHEIKLALTDAKSSPLLTRLLTPLTAVGNKLQSLGSGLKRGKVDQAAIESSNSDVSNITARASSFGQPIVDQPTPSLGG